MGGVQYGLNGSGEGDGVILGAGARLAHSDTSRRPSPMDMRGGRQTPLAVGGPPIPFHGTRGSGRGGVGSRGLALRTRPH